MGTKQMGTKQMGTKQMGTKQKYFCTGGEKKHIRKYL